MHNMDRTRRTFERDRGLVVVMMSSRGCVRKANATDAESRGGTTRHLDMTCYLSASRVRSPVFRWAIDSDPFPARGTGRAGFVSGARGTFPSCLLADVVHRLLSATPPGLIAKKRETQRFSGWVSNDRILFSRLLCADRQPSSSWTSSFFSGS